MLMQKCILRCIQSQNWFSAVDLKDPYFHILWFAYEGWVYQYMVLPFRLSLSPRVFTRVAEGTLALLREAGIRILNYGLIMAQSPLQASHWDLVLWQLS